MSNKLKLFNSNQQFLSEAEKAGQEIISHKVEENIFPDLAQFMEHPVSRKFYDKYIHSSSGNRDSMLLYCWMYKFLEMEAEKSGVTLTSPQKVAILMQCLRDRNFRPMVIEKYMNSFGRPKKTNNMITNNK